MCYSETEQAWGKLIIISRIFHFKSLMFRSVVIKIKSMIKSKQTKNNQANLMKYQDKVFDKFLSDLFPLQETKNDKDSDDPHYFI